MCRIGIAVWAMLMNSAFQAGAALLGAGMQAQGDSGLVASDLWRNRS